MTKILEEFKQELNKKLPNNTQIDLLISQLKAEDHSLSQTTKLYYNYYTALELAIYYDNAYAIEALIKAGEGINKANDKDLTPLQFAAQNDNVKAIEALLKLGATINLADKNGQTPFHIAVKNKKIRAIKALLKDNAEIAGEIINQADNKGFTPLHIAVNKNLTGAVVVLVMNDADVNKADNNGQTPFHLVFEHNPTPIELQGHKTNSIEFLLKLCEDVNKANNDGETPLLLAVRNNQTDQVIEALLKANADVNKANNVGETPLLLAVRNNQTDQVIEALLKANADVNKANNVGETPLLLAVENNQIDVIKLLLKNGANYDQFRSTDIPALLAEINKIDKTKELFVGDLSISVGEIDEEYLQYLCKQSGIPNHLLTADRDNPNSLAYIDILKKFQTPLGDIKADLNVFIGLLLHSDNKIDFPAISGFDFISISDFSVDEKSKKTIESYQKKPYLKPENFLNDEYLEEKLAIFARNKEQADNFFLVTKDWILSQQQHNFLNKLKEEYQKIPSYIKIDYSKKHQAFLQLCEKEAQWSMLSAENPEQTEPRNAPSPQPNPENAKSETSEIGRRFKSLESRLGDWAQSK